MPAPRHIKGKSKIAQATAEERLYDYAKGLRKFRKDRRAVCVHLSSLTRLFSDQRYKRASLRLFQPLMQEYEGLLVELYDGDILCALQGATFATMDAIVLKLRVMFRDDENLKAQEESESAEDIFATWWEIEKDYDDFLAFAKETYEAARIAEMEQAAANEQGDSIGDKIVALSNNDGGGLQGSSKLKGRFANVLGKRDNQEDTPAPEKQSSGFASKFGAVKDVSGLGSLAGRGKKPVADEPAKEPAAPTQPAATQPRPQQTQATPSHTNAPQRRPDQPTNTTANQRMSAQPQRPQQTAPEEEAPREMLAAQVSGNQNGDSENDSDRPPGIRRNIRYVEIKPPKKEIANRPVSALDLEKIETAILGADLSPMVRREKVKLIAKGTPPTVIFSDSMVPIPMVRERFLPLVDISTDRWFMRHLRELVDRRTLVAALDFSDPTALAKGFRVSTESIDSKEFEIFERNTRKLKRNQLILEFSFQDIVSNVAGYLRAQDILQARGYRICIGDMDPYMFTLINRSVIRSDFEKVRWTEDFHENATSEWQDVFAKMIKDVGSQRVIMVACKDEDALNAGQALGIKLFHGSYIENL